MFKAIKILVLLAIVVIAGIAVYVYAVDKPKEPTGAGAELSSPGEGRPIVSPEEKFGITTETVNP